jgi:hypothetical protein
MIKKSIDNKYKKDNKKISVETMFKLKQIFANPYKTYSQEEYESIIRYLKEMKFKLKK